MKASRVLRPPLGLWRVSLTAAAPGRECRAPGGGRRRVASSGQAERILSGGASATETARALGYRDSSSFGRAFRRWRGVSPTE